MKLVSYLLLFVGFFVLAFPQAASAQYKGGVTPTPQQNQDRAAKPIPKVFSSRVSSLVQAERLDVIYHNLDVSLWNFGVTDLIYQRELYALIEAERFKITRYKAEFATPLNNAMKNLNDNYKNLQDEIEKAHADYQGLRNTFLEEDLETLDSLWKERLEQFEVRSTRYFKMQHSYLTTYKSMVDFILSQGGSYAYNGIDGIRFYKVGGYKFFAKTLDKMRNITYNQRSFLRANAPVNVDVTLLANKGY